MGYVNSLLSLYFFSIILKLPQIKLLVDKHACFNVCVCIFFFCEDHKNLQREPSYFYNLYFTPTETLLHEINTYFLPEKQLF